MITTYKTSPAHGPYGARIWLMDDDTLTESVRNRMNFLSKWGGTDKSYNGRIAWEFSESRFREALSYLEGYGYVHDDD